MVLEGDKVGFADGIKFGSINGIEMVLSEGK